jgi:hypothetical protein
VVLRPMPLLGHPTITSPGSNGDFLLDTLESHL